MAHLISRIFIAICVVPIIVAIVKRQHLNKPLKLFLLYCILSLASNLLEQGFIIYATNYYESLEPYLTYFKISDTSFIGIVYYVIDFIVLGLFYKALLDSNHKGKIVYLIANVLLLACLINYFFIEGYTVYGKFNPAVDAFFVFGVAAYYLYFLFQSNLALPISRNPYAWISFALIVPHTIGIFLFIIGDVVHREDYKFFIALSSFKNIFLIIGQILMAVGFWYAPYTRFIGPKKM